MKQGVVFVESVMTLKIEAKINFAVFWPDHPYFLEQNNMDKFI